MLQHGRLRTFFFWAMILAYPLSANSESYIVAQEGEWIAIQDLKMQIPAGWRLGQNAKDKGVIILGFENAQDYLTFLVRKQSSFDADKIFAPALTFDNYTHEGPNSLHWRLREMRSVNYFTAEETATCGFWLIKNGFAYYGYVTSERMAKARATVELFLASLK